ncbi:MAG TPA: NADH-quinone oxidoreductase subunit L, partial [Armatimonadetes bacterium]|nr:NADH-quinone oxidoreductase subunit L [Armatimonadota bacterium]
AATLLFIGAIGKSAQFPLHVWLPDAMEGPTPVSALIHAATMVAAGVYMVARCYVLFDPHNVPAIGILGGALSIHPQIIVAYIGGFTAFMAATIAIAQDDIKRILAYSTISQLGYMMMGLGLGGYTAGTFHLMTHAFFKALLFLGAGSVIHAMHTNDIYQMGGLNKAMPITFATYVVGMSALAGVPPLSGFWSKDEILLSAFLHNKLLWVVGEAAAFLTALYMTRQVCIVFLHKPRLHDAHPHESPMVMWPPLVVLAIGAIIAGLPGMPWFNLYGQFVHYGEGAGETHGAPALLVMLVSIAMAIAGIWLGYHLYGRRQVASSREDPLRISLGKLYDFLEAKWRLDWYESNITRSAFFGVASMSRWFDLSVVDGTVNVIGYVTARIFAVIHRAFD